MYEYQSTIIRVIDGDTIVGDVHLGFGVLLRKQKFRLFDIDTPESRRNKRRGVGDKQVAHGLKAKALTMSLVGPIDGEPRTFTIKTHKDKGGKYGRWLADVRLSARKTLVKELRAAGMVKRKNYHEKK